VLKFYRLIKSSERKSDRCISRQIFYNLFKLKYVDDVEVWLVVHRISSDRFVVRTLVLKKQGLKSLLQTYLSLKINETDH